MITRRRSVHQLGKLLARVAAATLVVVFCGGLGSNAFTRAEETLESRLKQHVAYLADDALEGRGPRTRGLDLAADYIANEFREYGLYAKSYNGQPFQVFRTFTTKRVAAKTFTKAVTKTGSVDWKLGQHFTPLSSGAEGEFDAEVAFVGYGITAPDLDYDDYQDIDVEDKLVIVLRREPRQKDAKSPFAGTQNSPHAFLNKKIEVAVEHGAAGIVFVTDAVHITNGSPDNLLAFQVRGAKPGPIPVLHVNRAAIDRLLKSSGKPELSDLEHAIERDLVPQSFVLPGVRLTGSVAVSTATQSLKNVVGIAPGAGDLAEQIVIVGAHYDHLGRGGSGSLAPWTNDIHNGADDNASGVAGMLEIARALSRDKSARRRTMVFIAFSAEEMGLIGSEHYVDSPLHPLKSTAAMINLDMIGRMSKDKLYLHGVGTAKEFDGLATQEAKRIGLSFEKRQSGYGPSDHASFHARGVPVLHFFTGLHKDYHRPSDDIETLNYAGMAKITDSAIRITRQIAVADIPPTRTQANELTDLFGDSSPRSTGPRLGVTVTPSKAPAGLKIDKVHPGSNAADARLRAGDVITHSGGKPVTNVDELRNAVADGADSKMIALEVVRGELTLDFEIQVAP